MSAGVTGEVGAEKERLGVARREVRRAVCIVRAMVREGRGVGVRDEE